MKRKLFNFVASLLHPPIDNPPKSAVIACNKKGYAHARPSFTSISTNYFFLNFCFFLTVQR